MHDERPRELRALTGMRGLAAVAVVLFHFGRGRVPRSWAPIDALLEGGFTAVGLFFVLSGFVLAWSYANEGFGDRGSVRRFFRARFARIYPVYALSLLVGFAATLPKGLAALHAPAFWYKTALAAALLNAFDHRAMFHLNWAAWSLSAEASYYLAFPFALAALRAQSDRALVAMVASACLAELAIAALYVRLDPDGLHRPPRLGDEVVGVWYLKLSPLVHAPEFVVGVAAGVLFSRRRESIRPRLASLLAALLVALVGAAFASGLPLPYAYVHSGLFTPVFATIVFALAAARGRFASLLSSRVAAVAGRASYATYILHVPLFLAFARVAPGAWSRPWPFALYLALLACTSLAAHRFVEEPFRRRLAPAPSVRRAWAA